MADATQLGNTMLRAASSVEAAATALRLAREKHLGNPLAGVLGSSYGEGLEDDHRDYLRDAAANGVPARRLQPRQRVATKSHSSACDHATEMYSKSWKYNSFGVVIWATPAAEYILTASALVESPARRAPKMLPDGTVSSEGRPIHDMRSQTSWRPKKIGTAGMFQFSWFVQFC